MASGRVAQIHGTQHRSSGTGGKCGTGSLVDDRALQHLIHHVLFIHIVVHKSVIRKLVPALDVLNEVGAAVVGVPPGHRGTDWTHHRLGVRAVDYLAVLHKSFLVKVLLGTIRTRKSITVWYVPWLKGCIFGGGLHAFHNKTLIFGAGCNMGPDLGEEEIFVAAMARSLCALNLPLELGGSDPRCQSASTHPTDRLLRLQTFLQACRAKDVSAGHLHRLLVHLEAHGAREAAQGVHVDGGGGGARQLRAAIRR